MSQQTFQAFPILQNWINEPSYISFEPTLIASALSQKEHLKFARFCCLTPLESATALLAELRLSSPTFFMAHFCCAPQTPLEHIMDAVQKLVDNTFPKQQVGWQLILDDKLSNQQTHLELLYSAD